MPNILYFEFEVNGDPTRIPIELTKETGEALKRILTECSEVKGIHISGNYSIKNTKRGGEILPKFANLDLQLFATFKETCLPIWLTQTPTMG